MTNEIFTVTTISPERIFTDNYDYLFNLDYLDEKNVIIGFNIIAGVLSFDIYNLELSTNRYLKTYESGNINTFTDETVVKIAQSFYEKNKFFVFTSTNNNTLLIYELDLSDYKNVIYTGIFQKNVPLYTTTLSESEISSFFDPDISAPIIQAFDSSGVLLSNDISYVQTASDEYTITVSPTGSGTPSYVDLSIGSKDETVLSYNFQYVYDVEIDYSTVFSDKYFAIQLYGLDGSDITDTANYIKVDSTVEKVYIHFLTRTSGKAVLQSVNVLTDRIAEDIEQERIWSVENTLNTDNIIVQTFDSNGYLLSPIITVTGIGNIVAEHTYGVSGWLVAFKTSNSLKGKIIQDNTVLNSLVQIDDAFVMFTKKDLLDSAIPTSSVSPTAYSNTYEKILLLNEKDIDPFTNSTIKSLTSPEQVFSQPQDTPYFNESPIQEYVPDEREWVKNSEESNIWHNWIRTDSQETLDIATSNDQRLYTKLSTRYDTPVYSINIGIENLDATSSSPSATLFQIDDLKIAYDKDTDDIIATNGITSEKLLTYNLDGKASQITLSLKQLTSIKWGANVNIDYDSSPQVGSYYAFYSLDPLVTSTLKINPDKEFSLKFDYLDIQTWCEAYQYNQIEAIHKAYNNKLFTESGSETEITEEYQHLYLAYPRFKYYRTFALNLTNNIIEQWTLVPFTLTGVDFNKTTLEGKHFRFAKVLGNKSTMIPFKLHKIDVANNTMTFLLRLPAMKADDNGLFYVYYGTNVNESFDDIPELPYDQTYAKLSDMVFNDCSGYFLFEKVRKDNYGFYKDGGIFNANGDLYCWEKDINDKIYLSRIDNNRFYGLEHIYKYNKYDIIVKNLNETELAKVEDFMISTVAPEVNPAYVNIRNVDISNEEILSFSTTPSGV